MLQSRPQFRPAAVLLPALFLADCTINIAEFEFSIGTGPLLNCKIETAERGRQEFDQGSAFPRFSRSPD